MKKIILAVITFLVFIIACKDDEETNSSEDYNVEEQLENIFDTGIIAQIEILESSIIDFQNSIETFKADNTETNFLILQDQWKQLILDWKPLEVLTVGTFSLTSKINVIDYWPTSTTSIDASIQQNEEAVNLLTVQQLGGLAKGLAAIEYVLFGSDYETYVTAEFYENQILFLEALAEDLLDEVEDYESVWLANEEEFKTSLSNSISGTQNRLVNSMIYKIDELGSLKLADPLAQETTVKTELDSEAKYSEYSLQIIENEVEQIENIFTGLFTENSVENGLYSQLQYLDRQDIVDSLQENFETVYSILDSIDYSLEEAIVTNNITELTALVDALENLEIEIRTNVVSALNVTLTFSDNDGD